jgi:SAM-dependent methyltransferase
MSSPVPSATFQYYGSNYWNAIEMVESELRRRAADRPGQSWAQKLQEWHGGPFGKALALNCGNGWVERELVSTGVVASAVGVDISESLLAEARAKAAEAGLDISYEQRDTNTTELDFEGIDLVVNFAAMHHVARIDRVMRQLCRLLPEDGAFMSWDYIGPHRNQYPTAMWEAMWALNATLPPAMQKQLQYPHLPTMLDSDPTEAIHSELIMSTMRRYFHLDHVRYLGGALAYELLNFNDGFFDGGDHTALVQQLLDADAAYLGDDPEPNSLFVFVLARPNKDALLDSDLLAAWAQEEDERELHAERNGGRYYPDTMLAEYFQALEAARRASQPQPPRLNRALVRQVGSATKRSARELRDRLTNRS